MLFCNRDFVVSRRLAVAVPLALLGVVGLLAFAAAPASAAAGDHFTCRASALRVNVLSLLNVEPTVANSASDPCTSDQAKTVGIVLPGLLTTGVASATTTSAAGNGSAVGQVANASVPLLDLTASAATAYASYGCTNGSPTPLGNSTVLNLSVGGTLITVSGHYNLPLVIGGVADVQLGETITTATSVTRRAVDITVLGGVYGGAHVVLGEAIAGVSGNPCQTGVTSPPPPPVIQSGPPPSTPSTSATFVYITTIPGATLQCSLDGAPFTPCNGTTTLTGLSFGTHTFSVEQVVNGVAGTPVSLTWNVSKLLAPVNTGRPTISGSPKAGKTLSCSTGRWTNSPTRFDYQWSRDGTPIAGATHKTYRVQTSDEGLTLTCTVTASNAAGAGHPATSRRVAIAVPFVRRCPRATGQLSGRTLGLARLGMTRAQARRAFTHSSDRGRRFQDFFCLTPIGVRAGYASAALLTKFPSGERKRVQGRVVLALTANAFYALRGVRPGATLAAAHRALGTGAPFHVGLNFWYMAPNGSSTAVLKVRHGIVEEVGIADTQLTKSRIAQLAFIKSFS